MKITIPGYLKKNKLSISIALLVLFHITAIIGVSLGYKEWFVSKTPLTLFLSFVILVVNYPLNSFKKWAYAGVFFFGGMLIEWIGVHQGWPFGNYVYGENLGPKLDEVPYFIGIFWAVLTLITGDIASKISDNLLIRIFLGAFLMVLLDYFMETAAPQFDFWTFEGGMAPVKNYIAWFAVAAFLHLILQKVKLKGDFSFSLALYLIQLIFFSYFYVLYSI